MDLSYSQLELTLMTHFRVHPDKAGTFRSRVKQLQRLQFPPGVNVGRGAKMVYSLENLLQLVTAFELINQGLPAATATALTERFWRHFAAGYALSLSRQNLGKYQDFIYIRILNCSLQDLQGDSMSSRINVFVEDKDSLVEVLGANSRRMANTYTLLCCNDIVWSIMRDLECVAQVELPRLDVEPANWVVAGSDDNWWMRVDGGWKQWTPSIEENDQ